ncbi:unnamed protein product [Paramecium sonneborni]|uniref:Uncharacterized protein n=1 Tax=Paramecium sonneborni TaxID=65129 RepID=A0A8S1MLX2_9CILI|nr:unnamed protein product [Paramecium sonneborni]
MIATSKMIISHQKLHLLNQQGYHTNYPNPSLYCQDIFDLFLTLNQFGNLIKKIIDEQILIVNRKSFQSGYIWIQLNQLQKKLKHLQILCQNRYSGFMYLQCIRFCYRFSIIVCVLLNSGDWMYNYKFRRVAKQSFCYEIGYDIFYMIMGGRSYFKLDHFIFCFNRAESIRQFSFGQINKNPSKLFKERKNSQYIQGFNIPQSGYSIM